MLDDPARLAAVRAAEVAVLPDPTVLERLTDLARRLLDVDFAFLSLVGEGVEVLVAVQSPLGVPTVTLPREQSVCRLLVTSGRPLLVPDLLLHEDTRHLVEVQALGLRSYAGAPVRSRDDRVLGGLCVGSSGPRRWTPGDADLLVRLAEVATGALGDRVSLDLLAQAHADEQRRAHEQAVLHRVAALVAHGVPTGQVLQRTADELVGLLEARAVAVLRFHPDGGTSVLATAGEARDLGAAGWSAALLPHLPGPADGAAALLHDQPCAAVPVVVGGVVWGALVVLLGDDGSRGRVEHLEQLADFVALVLSNAEAQARLVRLARTDPLTGAPNRRVLEERLHGELRRLARSRGTLVVALLDIDHFKRVNDEHGHAAGDGVLRELAARVGRVLREGDLLARLGGDEWGLLLPDASEGAVEALERVRAAVVAAPLAGLPVTVTLGAAVVGGGAGVEQALQEADAALYEAKRQGRDRVVVRVVVSG